MDCKNIIDKLKLSADPANIAGMRRYAINTDNALGVSMPVIKQIARETGKNHSLALELWNTEVREARILAGLIDIASMVTESQIDCWVCDFNSWDICDSTCMHLFDKTIFANKKISQWCESECEFIKRAGFVLMASLAVHDKKAEDAIFIKFLGTIAEKSNDNRNFVKKAVNWALRQIGKRNLNLNRCAIETATAILNTDSRSAKWIASNALRELQCDKIQKRIAGKK